MSWWLGTSDLDDLFNPRKTTTSWLAQAWMQIGDFLGASEMCVEKSVFLLNAHQIKHDPWLKRILSSRDIALPADSLVSRSSNVVEQ